MNVFPSVFILSEDAVLRELLAQLLRRDRLLVGDGCTLADLSSARGPSEGAPSVVLIDAIESPLLADRLLLDADEVLGFENSALLLLAGSTTPERLLEHPDLDRVLQMPLSAEAVLASIQYHAFVRPRRFRGSEVRLRVPLGDGGPLGDEESGERKLPEAGSLGAGSLGAGSLGAGSLGASEGDRRTSSENVASSANVSAGATPKVAKG